MTIDRDNLRKEALGQLGLIAADPRWPGRVLALLDQIDQAEAERDEWRQTAQEEHAAALDLIEVVKERDARIQAVHAELLYPELHGHLKVWTHAIRRALDKKV